MSWFKVFKRYRNAHEFTDEDRNLSKEVREHRASLRKERLEIEKIKLEMEKLEYQARLQELREELFPQEEEEEAPQSPEMAILMSLMQGFISKSNIPPQPQNITPATKDKIVLTDDEIKAQISQIPSKYLKMAKVMPKEQIKSYILNINPDLSDETIDKAIAYVKN
jgi:hypothetical protein